MWLTRDGEVLATLEVADTAHRRAKGLLGRDDFEGAILLRPARSVHTIGLRFAIDVAFLDNDLVVIDMVSMRKGRIGRPRLKAKSVLEAESGAFARWNLHVGEQLEIKG